MKLVYELFPERYNPQLFINLFEFFPEGLIVAEEDNRVVGFLAGVISLKNTSRILLLGVDKNYRRRGIGSLLITSFLERMSLKGVKRVKLEVETDNTEAISFYKKHGFSIVDIVKNFYSVGRDAYIMVKEI